MPERHTDASVHASPLGKPHFASRWKQTPLRHTASFVGGPHGSAFGRPQRSSGSKHEAERHARAPFCGEHSPEMGATGERGSPFFALGVHEPAAQNSVVRQSASTVHTAPHEPVVRLQMGPARPTQSAFDEHFPHAPVAPQNGSVDVGQALGPAEPKSLVHPSQTFDVVHTGRAPVHSWDVAHSTHCPAFAPATRQTGAVTLGQARLDAAP